MAGPADSVQGKLFIGLILNVMLFGINVTQTYIYYIHSKKDRLWIKISVVIIFVADFIQPTLLYISLYRTLIVDFGSGITLATATNLFVIVPAMTGLTACIVQIFFAWRIRILTNNWYYVAFVVAAALSGGACSIVVAQAYVGYNPLYIEIRLYEVLAIIGFVSAMLGDIMITSILVWFLVRHHQLQSRWLTLLIEQMHKSGVRQSNKMVDRIICFIVQTGLLTLIFTGLTLLFYLIRPDGTFLLLNFITSKLYTSSLLCSLNSRRGWGYDTSENNDGQFDSFDLSTDLNMRFVTPHQSMVDRTSVVMVITTPLENELGLQNRHEVKENSGVDSDLEDSVTHSAST